MYQPTFNEREVLRFHQFSRRPYALFSCLGREVLIGVLSVASLTYAKANGISTRVDLADDSVAFNSVKLDEVEVTGSRAPLTAIESARVVEVITRDDIHRAGVTTINDLLKLTTGVDVRQRGGFGVQTDISIDGGTFDQITILLNGVNITNPQTGHNTGFFPVALSDIERIEVLRGASSRVLGTSAFNGAINIVTRSGVPGRSLTARVEGGSFGSFGAEGTAYAGTDASARVLPHSSILVSGGYHRSDGGTDNSDFERGHVFVQGRLRLGTMADLSVQTGGNQQSYGANTFYSANYNDQYEKTDNLMAAARLSLHDREHRWEVAPQLYGNRYYDHYQLIRGQHGAANGENYHDLLVYGGGVNAYLKWLAGRTSVGFDIRKEDIYSTAYGAPLDSADMKEIGDGKGLYDHRGGRTNTSFFLEHNVIVGGFTLSAGVMANRNTGLDGDYRFYPGVDVSYRPDDHWKVYASYNKALRLPTYTDLYTSNVAQQGDVNLKPEKKDEVRIGTRYRRVGVDVVVNAFYSHGTNMIDWVYETEDATKYHALNIGLLNNMGASLDATLRPADLMAGCPVEKVSIGYAYIHQHHETTATIYRSLYALEYLRHKFVVSVDHRIWSLLSAHWDLRWQQRMNGYTPYWKLDGKLQWTARHYDLYLSADNITGHRYYDLTAVEQPGLWIMAGVKVKL